LRHCLFFRNEFYLGNIKENNYSNLTLQVAAIKTNIFAK
jgi:hypothetical protein